MKVVIYETAEPLTPSERFIAFLAHDGSRTKDGVTTRWESLLPVHFPASTAEDAQNNALRFWMDETAKAAAKRHLGREAAERLKQSRRTARLGEGG